LKSFEEMKFLESKNLENGDFAKTKPEEDLFPGKIKENS
jgi:hypothetical protein